MAKDLATLSLISYCIPEKIKKWKCGRGCQDFPDKLLDIEVIANSTAYSGAYLGYSTKYNSIIIGFRGTEPWRIKNIIEDMTYFKEKYDKCDNKCKVHKGFLYEFNSLKDQLLTSFKNIKNKHPNSKIFITGHSLGGALCHLSVPYLLELNNFEPIEYLYTYGEPRIGDKDYAQWFQQIKDKYIINFSRITYNNDPIPHLTPSEFPFNYYHVGYEVFYKNFHKNMFVQCVDQEDRKCANGIIAPLNIYDHLSYFGWNWINDIILCQ